MIRSSAPRQTVVLPLAAIEAVIGRAFAVRANAQKRAEGVELKQSYWKQAVENLSQIEGQSELFAEPT